MKEHIKTFCYCEYKIDSKTWFTVTKKHTDYLEVEYFDGVTYSNIELELYTSKKKAEQFVVIDDTIIYATDYVNDVTNVFICL